MIGLGAGHLVGRGRPEAGGRIQVSGGGAGHLVGQGRPEAGGRMQVSGGGEGHLLGRGRPEAGGRIQASGGPEFMIRNGFNADLDKDLAIWGNKDTDSALVLKEKRKKCRVQRSLVGITESFLSCLMNLESCEPGEMRRRQG